MNTRAQTPGNPRRRAEPRRSAVRGFGVQSSPMRRIRAAANGRESVMIANLESMTQKQYDEYRAACDRRSAAEFRMRRELCGIELAELADALGVRLDTAKRWENPKKGAPPSPRAWACIDAAYESLLRAVDAAIDQAEAAEAETGSAPARITVAYRRGRMPTRDGESVGRANAVSRAAALALTALGYDVTAEWADEGASALAARAPRE